MKIKSPGINKISFGSNVFLTVLFIIITILCLAPILLVIMISLTDERTILQNGYSFLPQKFSVQSYQYLLKGGSLIMNAYGVSIIVAIIGTVLSLLTITLYAYPLSRNDFKYKGFFAFLAYFTTIFGGGLVPWVMVYNQLLPIANSIWVLIFPMLINAWYVIIMRTFIKTTVPEAIIESARIDGAGEFKTLFAIVLPLCKAGLATIGLFAMLGYWNDWYLPLLFVTDKKVYNIQYLMYQTLQNIQFLSTTTIGNASDIAASLPSEGARMAIAVLSIGPIIFAYPFFQGYFVKGLTIGAVKG
ncbi:carbohydrate ABC transporter permease [Acetanaerobacterium elongatum]|uniref:Putative aldouronate transport system permease protein n=1 Tax=Acetanaerobacterium elongatum TaxID=258515 RepID=A0A1G9WA68_9FIRM|nr:carbohydrate ABC transporter permease [Acetanaerobacterium elongatum]SDM81163.1 putative aldouronate transport system permease protein [Acetanaerobacterium elongatum]